MLYYKLMKLILWRLFVFPFSLFLIIPISFLFFVLRMDKDLFDVKLTMKYIFDLGWNGFYKED